MSRLAIALALYVLAPTEAPASVVVQDSIPWPAANRLTVTVAARLAEARGDTLRVVYRIDNSRASAQAGDFVVVRTDAPVVNASGPLGWYASFGVVADSAAVSWSTLVRRVSVAPGQTRDGFAYTGIGALGVVAYRVQGDYAVPEATDTTEGLVMTAPSVWANAAVGWTLGVTPIPPGATAAALLARTRDLLGRACDLGWIANRGTCNSLQAKLSAAGASLARGNQQAARGQIGAFLNEVDALPASRLSDEARALLRSNAGFLERLLQR